MAESWTDEIPEEIPMVPDEFTFDEFKGRKAVIESFNQLQLPFGLDLELTLPVSYSMATDPLFVIANDSPNQFAMFSQLISQLVQEQYESGVHVNVKKLVSDNLRHLKK